MTQTGESPQRIIAVERYIWGIRTTALASAVVEQRGDALAALDLVNLLLLEKITNKRKKYIQQLNAVKSFQEAK